MVKKFQLLATMHNYLWLCTIVSSKKKKKYIYIYIYIKLSLSLKKYFIFSFFFSLSGFSSFFLFPSHFFSLSLIAQTHLVQSSISSLLWVCLRFVLHLAKSSTPPTQAIFPTMYEFRILCYKAKSMSMTSTALQH